MNHYPRHIGDWLRDTAHLSEVEECIYSRCIDQYYSREKPLPLDTAQCARLVRAITAGARKAMETILPEFFTKQEDGWHQKRCDEEIAKFHDKDADGNAKREHERERQQRHRARRKELFAALRERGTVPAWDIPITELETLYERVCHAPVTRTATANQNQQPEPSSSKPLSAAPTEPAGFAEFWKAYPPKHRRVAKTKCLKAWVAGKLEPLSDAIVSHVQAMGRTKQWQDGYEPAPLTYLNQRRWEDGLPTSNDDSRAVAM